jgi:hypothetical protein
MATADITLDSTQGALKGNVVFPVSLLCTPKIVIPATEMDGVNASPIQDPDADISTIATNRIFKIHQGVATTIFASMAYDDGISGVTNPIVALCGRRNAQDYWRLLPNSLGAITSTIAVDLTNDLDMDITQPFTLTGMSFTTVFAGQTWDTNGCAEFVFSIDTALAASSGDVTTAVLLAWAI